VRNCPARPRPRPCGAFTLVEVILAISIAIGILVVALYFYGQATDLRARLIEEAERISSIRLCLDRLGSDLRQAFAQPQIGFTGTASSMHFVTAGLPLRSAPSAASWSQPILLDLRIVSYAANVSNEGTNQVVTGLSRSEAPLLDQPPTGSFSTNSPAAAATLAGVGATAPGSPLPTPAGAGAGRKGSLWIDSIHFLQLAYWDGSGWSDHWDSSVPPEAVEVLLGAEALPEGTDPMDYPFELFRRVIYLPGSRGADDPLDLFAVGAPLPPGPRLALAP
jgi:type II secretory pathway pseudopilin PulG